MDEKPKSIWKKSWKGPRAFLFWLLTVAVAGFLAAVTFISMAFGTPMFPHYTGFEDFIGYAFAMMIGFIIAVGIVFIFYKIVRWLFCWRNFKRFLFGLACLVTLIALFYAEEDWRGKHDWEKFKHEWEAKGEKFDWQSIIPPPVPDDQNFAMAPIWVESMKAVLGPDNSHQWFGNNYAENGRTNFTDRLALNLVRNNDWADSPTNGNWAKGTITDLKPWRAYYRTPAHRNRTSTIVTNEFPVAPQPQTPAQDVLLALSKYDSTIEELRQTSQRPYSRFPINYSDSDQPAAAILLPHLGDLKRSSQVIQLRSIAELQNDESEKALEDVKLMLRLINSVRTEPWLISHLVRIAVLQIALQPVWEGLAEHKWSDTQLADLDSELAKLDFLADYEFAVRGERTLEIANIEFLRHPPHNPPFGPRPRFYFIVPLLSLMRELSNLSGSGEDFQMNFQLLALSLGPSGWLYQNELNIAQFDTKWYLPIIDQETKTISPAKTRTADDALGQEIQRQTPENILEVWLLPALGKVVQKFAYAQSSVDLARVAIALERYRLAHGEFPESLDSLAPQFMEKIPHDIIGGQPLHYRRTDDGQFVLYSIGWKETDDGGVVVLSNGETPGVDRNKGDWVWRYPSK
jgi:hypothetical protein